MIKKINFYPPYLFSGIKLKEVNDEMTRFVVELRMTWYNRNLFKTHFGGSMYAMCDPWFVFILLMNLGKEYIVWDKSAAIRFKKPGTGRVKALFEISNAKIEEIKTEIDSIGKNTYILTTEIKNEEGVVVAEVDKEIYVRKKGFVFEE